MVRRPVVRPLPQHFVGNLYRRSLLTLPQALRQAPTANIETMVQMIHVAQMGELRGKEPCFEQKLMEIAATSPTTRIAKLRQLLQEATRE